MSECPESIIAILTSHNPNITCINHLNNCYRTPSQLWSLIHQHIDTEDLAHDPLHILRVYHWTCRLAPEAGANVELSGAAALLHDLINIPKESPQRSNAADESAKASHPWLLKSGFNPEECTAVMDAIETAHGRRVSPVNPEGLALQEADRLMLGAIGVMRNIACAQAMKARGNPGVLYHPEDPIATSERPLDDRHYAIDHFRPSYQIAKALTLPSAIKEGKTTPVYASFWDSEHEIIIPICSCLPKQQL